jgi:hypothetical protein
VSLSTAADLLKVQLRDAWAQARWLLEDIDDDVFLWAAARVRGWGRGRDSGRRGWGAGEYVCEDAWPPPEPLPIPTIAWRVIHLAAWTDIYRGFAFEGTRPDLNEFEVPGDAAGGLAALYRAQDDFMAAVDAIDDAEVFEPRPAHWGELELARLVMTMLTEHIHHIAEIGLLRDLRRGRARVQPPPHA